MAHTHTSAAHAVDRIGSTGDADQRQVSNVLATPGRNANAIPAAGQHLTLAPARLRADVDASTAGASAVTSGRE